jgi:hypothetical protein
LSTNNNSPPISSSPLKLHIPQLPQSSLLATATAGKILKYPLHKNGSKNHRKYNKNTTNPNPSEKPTPINSKKMFLLFCKQIRWAFRYSRQQNANQKTHSKIEKERESDGEEERTLLSVSLSLSLSLCLSPSPVVVFFVFVALVDD